MNENKTIFRNPVFNIAVISGCIITTVLLAFDDEPLYSSVALLPLFYIIVYMFSLIITPRTAYHNMGYVLYFGQSIIKCVIAPLFLYMGNYTSLFGGLNSDYIFKGVLLLIYEHLICTIVIGLSAKRTKVILNMPIKTTAPKFNPATLVLLMSAFMVMIWIAVPTVQNNFVTVFDMFSSQEMFFGYDYTSTNAVGTINRILTTLFLVLFKSFRIILPFYMIKALKEKYDSFVSFLISIIIVMLQFLFISETVAMALVVAFILLSYMLKAYPQYRRLVIIIMSISFAFAVFVLSLNFDYMAKWYGVNNIAEYISQVLQSYVPGICNAASIFRVEETSRITTLIDTLVSTIPFQNTLFGSVSWNNDLNTLFTSTSGLNAQIVSTIAGGWYIFGFVFAPVFSAIFVRVSMINGYKYAETDNDLERILYLFMCIQTMLGIGVYNIQTTITLWIQVGLVLWLCSKLAVKRKIAGGVNNLFVYPHIIRYIDSVEPVFQMLLNRWHLNYKRVYGGSLA